MSIKNPLGDKTEYVDQYDPSLLFPIKRTIARDHLGLTESLPFRGEDRWTAYEVSWLDAKGKPQVRLAEFIFPCDSPNIVESKSFKLYLNSFNQTVFEGDHKVTLTLSVDLSTVAEAAVQVNLLPLHYAQSCAVSEPIGLYLDEMDIAIKHYQPAPELLRVSSDERANEVLYSHLLKTNCPVTDQPDWATVFVEYSGAAIDHGSLLEYIISFRDHQDYHENSVERLFCDIQTYCQPDSLAVYARYTRRGGLDINPLRSSYPAGKSLLESNMLRMVRQ